MAARALQTQNLVGLRHEGRIHPVDLEYPIPSTTFELAKCQIYNKCSTARAHDARL